MSDRPECDHAPSCSQPRVAGFPAREAVSLAWSVARGGRPSPGRAVQAAARAVWHRGPPVMAPLWGLVVLLLMARLSSQGEQWLSIVLIDDLIIS